MRADSDFNIDCRRWRSGDFVAADSVVNFNNDIIGRDLIHHAEQSVAANVERRIRRADNGIGIRHAARVKDRAAFAVYHRGDSFLRRSVYHRRGGGIRADAFVDVDGYCHAGSVGCGVAGIILRAQRQDAQLQAVGFV